MGITKLQTGLAFAVVLGVGGAVFHQHTTAALERQIDHLTRKNEELVERREENYRLRHAAISSSQAAPVGNVAAIAAEVARPAVPKVPSMRNAVPLAAGLIPVENLDHLSHATARAAFSAQLWAAAQGDVDLEQSSILLQPEARAKLTALLATLPSSVRDTYGTPERLMASVLAGSPHPVGGVQILGEKIADESTVMLETQWQHADDEIVHHSNVELQRDNAGNWRFVVPAVLVDRAVTYLKGNFTPKISP